MTEMDEQKSMLGIRGWTYTGGRISKTYTLGSFTEAIEFVNDVAAILESKEKNMGRSKSSNSTDASITVEGKSVRLLLAYDDAGTATAEAVDDLYEMNYASDEGEDELLRHEEDRERARFRSRGPYRKSSSAGLR